MININLFTCSYYNCLTDYFEIQKNESGLSENIIDQLFVKKQKYNFRTAMFI